MKNVTSLLIIFLIVLSCKAQDVVPTKFSAEALNDTFITLKGDTIAFKDILETYKGKTVVIDIWASWCKDCVGGMPKVKKVQGEFKDAVYLFLSLDKTDKAWKKGIKKYKVKGEHYFMQSGWKGVFGNFVQLDWIPRYMVINKAGEIVVFKVIEADDNKLIEALKN
ncbi:TlpA family protein disulfide reductase [Thalassobellus citreus]|uniref:TlpA family protein disulfide reductase n=1 Tax=Thalassobellus citreus TaxID=3367752 RepID=UPI0037A09F2A